MNVYEDVLLPAVREARRSLPNASALEENLDAPLFGPGSTLDSMGLVTFLVLVEEQLEQQGFGLTLASERAMSAKHSPFRSLRALSALIEAELHTGT